MEELTWFAWLLLCKRCLQAFQLRGLNAVAFWQLARHERSEMSGG